MSLFKNFNLKRLKEGLSKTRNKIINSITETVTGKAVIDEMTIEEIESILISSDIGFETTEKIIDELRKNLKSEKERTSENILRIVQTQLVETLNSAKQKTEYINNAKPYIILVIGVNGVGKTTTIGKLANNYKKIGKKVIVGAADTFRAAANEQLEIWAKRADVDIIQKSKSSDPSSVVFETINKAIKDDYDVVLIDTAGRLHNKTNLMNELEKINRVIQKFAPNGPNETLLVLDGTTGQNALIQAQEFSKVANISGLVITKLDGTAKGGVIFQIVSKQQVSVKFIGVGEGIDDLLEFEPESFVKAIFN